MSKFAPADAPQAKSSKVPTKPLKTKTKKITKKKLTLAISGAETLPPQEVKKQKKLVARLLKKKNQENSTPPGELTETDLKKIEKKNQRQLKQNAKKKVKKQTLKKTLKTANSNVTPKIEGAEAKPALNDPSPNIQPSGSEVQPNSPSVKPTGPNVTPNKPTPTGFKVKPTGPRVTPSSFKVKPNAFPKFGNHNINYQNNKSPKWKQPRIMMNSMQRSLAHFYGFRLEALRREMTGMGLHISQITNTLKYEMHKAKQIFLKQRPCSHCRDPRHNVIECPGLADQQEKQVDQLKPGQAQVQGEVVKKPVYKFAPCYICKEPGHLAYQCPENPEGGDVTGVKADEMNGSAEISVKTE